MAEAFGAITNDENIEDIVVPLAMIPDLMTELKELSGKYNIVMPCYGHAGDGNMHVHSYRRPEMSHEEWKATLPVLLNDLYSRVAALGGTISGEHGIGHKRSRYLSLVLEPEVISLQRRIKQLFDPNGILNPGKIFID